MKFSTFLLQSSGGSSFMPIIFLLIIIAYIAYVVFNNKKKSPSNPTNQNNRYPALRTIALVYKAIAWIAGIITIIAVFFFISENYGSVIQGLIGLIIGLLSALGLLAISESIMVFLDIEQNTREKANKQDRESQNS